MEVAVFAAGVGEKTSIVYAIYGQYFDACSLERVDFKAPPRFKKIEGVVTTWFDTHPFIVIEKERMVVCYLVKDRIIESDGTCYLPRYPEEFVSITAVTSVLPLRALDAKRPSSSQIKEALKNPKPSSIIPSLPLDQYLSRIYRLYCVGSVDSVVTRGLPLPIRDFDAEAEVIEIDPMIQPYFGSDLSGNRGVTAKGKDGQMFVMKCWVTPKDDGSFEYSAMRTKT